MKFSKIKEVTNQKILETSLKKIRLFPNNFKGPRIIFKNIKGIKMFSTKENIELTKPKAQLQNNYQGRKQK